MNEKNIDTGSSNAQLIILTKKLINLNKLSKEFPKNFCTKKKIAKLVKHRNVLFNYLKRKNPDAFYQAKEDIKNIK